MAQGAHAAPESAVADLVEQSVGAGAALRPPLAQIRLVDTPPQKACVLASIGTDWPLPTTPSILTPAKMREQDPYQTKIITSQS